MNKLLQLLKLEPHKHCHPKYIAKNFPNEYNEILSLPGRTFAEKLYMYKNGLINIPTCPICGKIVKYSSNGYKKYCSYKCSARAEQTKNIRKQTCQKKYGVDNVSTITRDKFKNTMQKKYGVEHALQHESFKDKFKQTSLKRFGTVMPSSSQQIKDKVRSTNIERYGCFRSADAIKKYKQTCLERYNGVGFASPELVEKIKQIKLERYGDANYNNREKAKQTNLIRYGVEHYTNHDKYIQTCLERYGVPCTFQSPKIKEKIKQTLKEKYDVEYITQSPEILNKIIETCLEKYGIPYGFLNTEPGYSKESQLFFDSLKEQYPNAVYATNGGEHKVGPYLLDWYDPDTNTAIEFNGDYWHANPAFYEPDWIHPIKKCTAKEIWEKDLKKMEYLLENGINVYVVWESDIKSPQHINLDGLNRSE